MVTRPPRRRSATVFSSLPPRGASSVGPSTYWIGVADAGARRAADTGDEKPFTGGNITLQRVIAGKVVASFDFDEDGEPNEAMPLDDFLELLAAWRYARTAAARPDRADRRAPVRAATWPTDTLTKDRSRCDERDGDRGLRRARTS